MIWRNQLTIWIRTRVSQQPLQTTCRSKFAKFCSDSDDDAAKEVAASDDEDGGAVGKTGLESSDDEDEPVKKTTVAYDKDSSGNKF